MARPPRIIQTEYPYHLICRTNNRTFRFHRKKTIKLFAQVIKKVSDKYGLKIHHFVLLSNHYHIIATATENNLHRAMQYLNSRVAVRFNRISGRSGHLWGDRYKSCIISTDRYYLHCVRYIYRNPIRAKMVEELEDFEDSTLQFYAFGRKIDIDICDDHLVLNLDGDRERISEYFRILVLGEGEWIPPDSYVKKSLRRMFYGPADFIQRMEQAYLMQ